MKKNFAMRVAACLLVVTMLSLCMVSYTYAKFTTTDTGHDEARVAKWGVVITLADFDMFETNYNDSVTSQNTDKLVAPGTEGELAYTGLSGQPEVDVEVKFEADLQLTGWTVDGEYYCPLEITVGDDTYKGTDYNSSAEFEAAVEDAIAAYTENYDVNTILENVDAPEVSWKWLIETGSTAEEKAANNAKDTALGKAAANGNAATIKLILTATVTQLD